MNDIVKKKHILFSMFKLEKVVANVESDKTINTELLV